MAKKTDTEGRPSSARRSRTAGAEENAYVEQISELLLVHNKDDPGHGVRAVSKAHGDGKCETVPATEENENSFLKFDKNSGDGGERKLVPEVRQELKHHRELHQELLEPIKGAYAFPPVADDSQRLQAQQTGHKGPGRRQADGHGKGVP